MTTRKETLLFDSEGREHLPECIDAALNAGVGKVDNGLLIAACTGSFSPSETRGRGRIALVAQSDDREVEAWLPGGYALSATIIGSLRSLPGIVEVQEI